MSKWGQVLTYNLSPELGGVDVTGRTPFRHAMISRVENATAQVGHLMRYQGSQQWEDLGAAPPGCNCLEAITFHNGHLDAATGRYNPNDSMLGDAKNLVPGGNVYRIEDGNWIDCGKPAAEGAVPDEDPDCYNNAHTDKALPDDVPW